MFYGIISGIFPEFSRGIFPEKYRYFLKISGIIPEEISGNFLTHIPSHAYALRHALF